MKLLVFSAMKDEGPDVLEWVCFHRALGFDEVLVYTNDCTDGSDELLDALQSAGLCHHRRHSVEGQPLAPQDAAARLIFDDPVYRAADWAIWVDADEFLLPLSVPDVRALVAALEDRAADAIALPWRNFGSSGHVEVPAGLVIENFNMTSGQLTRMERTFKCLFRTAAPIRELFVHRPVWAEGPPIRFVGPDLAPLPDGFSARTKENGNPDELLPTDRNAGERVAQINHYPVKSLRQFLLKRSRKDGLGHKGRFADGYLNRFDFNEIQDDRIHRFAGDVKTLMAKALSDPEVARSHATTTRIRDERAAATEPAKIDRGRGKKIPPAVPPPQPQPQSQLSPPSSLTLKKRVSPHGKVMAVSMMKDEAPFLLEWFAHHLAVGFTDILVYTNDCTDGTVEMLQRLEQLGLGHHRPNVIKPGIKPQPSALSHAQVEPLVQDADWLMVFDADEFLAINHPSGTLDGMLDDAVAQDANGIIVTWRIFGSNGVVDWSRAPVTEQYTSAAPTDWNKGWGVKTLFRFDHEYWKLGIHRPSIRNKHLEDGFPETVRWLNGSGEPMEEYFKFHGWRSIKRTIGYDWAQMNHYAVKSVDSYALRKFRGNVNNKADKYNADYWALQDRNEVPDTRILRHAPARAAIMAELLTDPVLRELHEKALARAEARLDEYRQTDGYRTLRDGLIAAGKVPITNVEAKPPKARDPARIAQRMSRVGQPADPLPDDDRQDTDAAVPTGDEPYVIPVDLAGDGGIQWVANREIQLPADPRLFAPEALRSVRAGKFQRRHARNVTSYLTGCRRLLDVGAGVGFPALCALGAMPGLVVMLQDDRPGVAAATRLIAARNGMDDSARLKIVDGPLRLDADGPAQLTGLAACLHDFRPDALRLSRPELLPPEALALLPLDTLRRVIVPFEADEDWRATIGEALPAAGFAEASDRAAGGSLLFVRN